MSPRTCVYTEPLDGSDFKLAICRRYNKQIDRNELNQNLMGHTMVEKLLVIVPDFVAPSEIDPVLNAHPCKQILQTHTCLCNKGI